MIPRLEIEREKRYKKELKYDITAEVAGGIGLLCGIVSLILSITANNIAMIVFNSCLISASLIFAIFNIPFLIADYNNYKWYRDYNKTVIELMTLDILTSAIIEVATREDKEKTTKTTTKKKTTRKRK
ncbi:MAG: hypothetical protein IKI95_01575 [Clostridia bacterium]|nr:hypothetical protein [Clostridia bacterium]